MTDKEKKRNQLKYYARYSGMATEMFGLILVLVFAGLYVDKKMDNPKNYVTAFLVLVGVIGYLYKLYVELTKSGKK